MRQARGTKQWGPTSRYDYLAGLFVLNGQRFGVDPVVIACVAYAESRYRDNPPRLMRKVCKTNMIACDKPGPCAKYTHTVDCRMRWINNQEAGMMQVDNRWAGPEYTTCTGKKLPRGRAARIRALTTTSVSVCVAALKLKHYRGWARRSRRRMAPVARRNVAYFSRRPGLRRLFWVAYYNWGPNRRLGNAYPRIVASCYRRFRRLINAR